MKRHKFFSACIAVVMLLSSCDATVENGDEASLSGVSSSSSQSCASLSRDVIFDNFDYSAASHASGGLYGVNFWNTCTSTDQETRMWYEYNHDDLSFDASASVAITGGGSWKRLRFQVNPGFPSSSHKRPPIIRSGTETIQGTYAARVKFGDIAEYGPRVTMAFWTQQDQEPHDAGTTTGNYEMDFEWNNWFQSNWRNGPIMNVTNHKAGNASSYLNELDCTYYSNGNSVFRDKCGQGQFTYSDPNLSANSDDSALSPAKGPSDPGPTANWDSYLVGEISPGRYENEWWTLMAVNKGYRVEYSMLSDGYGGVYGSVWGGGSSYGQPKMIYSNVPNVPMNVEFAILPFPEYPYLVTQQLEMEVDWFYYTPATNVSIGQVQNDVAILANIGPRVNTTGLSLSGTN